MGEWTQISGFEAAMNRADPADELADAVRRFEPVARHSVKCGKISDPEVCECGLYDVLDALARYDASKAESSLNAQAAELAERQRRFTLPVPALTYVTDEMEARGWGWADLFAAAFGTSVEMWERLSQLDVSADTGGACEDCGTPRKLTQKMAGPVWLADCQCAELRTEDGAARRFPDPEPQPTERPGKRPWETWTDPEPQPTDDPRIHPGFGPVATDGARLRTELDARKAAHEVGVHRLRTAIEWLCTEMSVGWEEMAEGEGRHDVVRTVKAALAQMDEAGRGTTDGEDPHECAEPFYVCEHVEIDGRVYEVTYVNVIDGHLRGRLVPVEGEPACAHPDHIDAVYTATACPGCQGELQQPSPGECCSTDKPTDADTVMVDPPEGGAT